MSKSESLSVTHPEVAKQAHGWDPSEITFGSNLRKEWMCEFGHVWNAKVSARSRGTGCPICSGNKVLIGVNDLATVNPELASQAHGWDPRTVTSGSNLKKDWKCNFDHVWNACINNRSGGLGCPFCSGRKVLAGFNDLATVNPELASQAHGWDPRTVVQFSNASRDWKCTLGHVWAAQISGRSRGNGCPVCGGKKILVGFNDLATLKPEVATQAHGWDPTTVTCNVSTKKDWKCESGHVWSAAVSDRSGGHQCPICSGNKVLAGFNDLATVNPELASQAHGWDPSTLTIGSETKKPWKCQFGHEWTASVKDRTRGRDCPSCSQTGFDPNKDGWLYFLEHEDWEMLQIGITNVPDDRLATHKKLGWTVLELRGPMDGDLARQWETDILRMLRKKSAIVGSTEIAGRFTGYTESWLKKLFPVSSLKDLMEHVRTEEEKK
jgi:translation initiation factor IF-1